MILSDPGGWGDPFDPLGGGGGVKKKIFPKLLKNTFVLLRNDFKWPWGWGDPFDPLGGGGVKKNFFPEIAQKYFCATQKWF